MVPPTAEPDASAVAPAPPPAASDSAPTGTLSVSPRPPLAVARFGWTMVILGLAVSVLGHAGVVFWAIGLWDIAAPLSAAPPPSITVDLVPETEASSAPQNPYALEKGATASAPPAPPETPVAAPPQSQAAPEPQPQVAPTLQPQAAPDPPPQAAPAPTSSPLVPPPPFVPSDELAGLAPDDAAPPPDTTTALRLAQSLQLPIILPDSEGGAIAADTKAKLAGSVIADFKDHLRACWKTPTEAESDTRVKILVRVALRPDGRIIGEPALIQAVASPAGPAVVKSAIKALQQCQPYSFLPADKYKEWRALDIGFSAQGVL